MAQLCTHKKDDLCNEEWMYATTRMPVVPGAFVHHKDDERSFGLVVSRHGDWHAQCEVLWSIQPQIVNDEDVMYFQQSLCKALKMPPAYLGFSP